MSDSAESNESKAERQHWVIRSIHKQARAAPIGDVATGCLYSTSKAWAKGRGKPSQTPA